MIQLHVTLFEDDKGNSRFKVLLPDPDDQGKLVDVTDRYEVAPTETEDGRRGFLVLPLDKPKEAPKKAPGCGIPYHPQPCDCGGAT
jgi:hypothetical protein